MTRAHQLGIEHTIYQVVDALRDRGLELADIYTALAAVVTDNADMVRSDQAVKASDELLTRGGSCVEPCAECGGIGWDVFEAHRDSGVTLEIEKNDCCVARGIEDDLDAMTHVAFLWTAHFETRCPESLFTNDIGEQVADACRKLHELEKRYFPDV